MDSIVKFVNPKRVTVQTPQGERLSLGLGNDVPFPLQEQEAQLLAYLFDKYYKGDPGVIMGPIFRELMMRRSFCHIYWCGPDRNDERERIGAQIRNLREERRMEGKELAQLADLDASNLSRIERGKYSPGLDTLCKIAAALDCSIEFRPNSNVVSSCRMIEEYPHQDILITAKRSTFRLEDCLAKYGQYHWQSTRFNVHVGDTVYVYSSEDKAIKFRMRVDEVEIPYGRWMNNEEEFWTDHERVDADESKTKYALLVLEKESKSGKLTEENLVQHGFSRAPQGIKRLEGDLLKYIERRF